MPSSPGVRWLDSAVAASIVRNREVLESGGWTLGDLWTVDLFPQTPHPKAVGRFTKDVIA